jgi:hypothetical protein
MAYKETRLDQKLRAIRSGNYRRSDFIIADAKDGDMSSGLAATGFARASDGGQGKPHSRSAFLDQIKAIVEQDVIDIMLVSASNLELLHERGVFTASSVKPAIRANDTTDCWGGVRHQKYTQRHSRPFRTANLARVVLGSEARATNEPAYLTDLGLYSVTFTNDLDHDYEALEAFAKFRGEAADFDFRYFLEVFNPNVGCGLEKEELGEYINDSILRCLAGVTKPDRPQFLKVVYNGPRALEELASFDPSLVVGVLGGGAGTTRDTFELLHQAEKYGARVALFGRKINLAEDPLALLRLMRAVVNGGVSPEEAVKAYHGELAKLNVRSKRSLDEDRQITEAVLKPGLKHAA